MQECIRAKAQKSNRDRKSKSDESHAWMANGISQAHHHNTFHFFYESLKAAVDNDIFYFSSLQKKKENFMSIPRSLMCS